jgi:hypothetical protein
MPSAPLTSGVCYAVFAYDIGFGVDLGKAASIVSSLDSYQAAPRQKPAPRYLNFKQDPLRMALAGDSVAVGRARTAPPAEVVVFPFGAASITYRIPVQGELSEWIDLSSELYESSALHVESRRRIEEVARGIAAAVDRPEIADFVEDYAMFHIESFAGAEGSRAPATDILASHRHAFAQILGSEPQPLSSDQVNDLLQSRISYGPDDEAIVGWNGALFLRHPDVSGLRAVLEYANVALLKLRRLDDRLDRLLDRSYSALARREAQVGWRRRYPLLPDRESPVLSRFQMDSALLYEGVTNALKLVGDQYLARIYQLAAQRMHLSEWDASITRKLQTLDGIYEKVSDRAAARRMEVLEWIIIVLIAISILTVFA